MTATANPVALLLDDLTRRGIMIEAVGEKVRFRPRDRMTPDLAARLMAQKADVLALLRAPVPEGQSSAVGDIDPYTGRERQLKSKAPKGMRARTDEVKTIPADTDQFPNESLRHKAAHLIRAARRAGNPDLAVDLRDRWHERVAICIVDGGLSRVGAETIALEKLKGRLTIDNH